MAKGYSKKKLWRHGGVTLALTVAIMASLILVNAVFSTLSARYGWYVNMNPRVVYPVSDTCYDYLEDEILPSTDAKITFTFCMTAEEAESSDTQRYIYRTAGELASKYPDKIEISHLDIIQNPTRARELDIDSTSDVVVIYKDAHRVCNATDFYAFSAADGATPTAYMGDRRFAVAMKAVTATETPVCYFTLNHGETLPDNEIMHTVVDAGYNVSYLDLLSYDIPEDCDLIITCNPARDLTVEDGTSGISEVDKLRDFMKKGGKLAVFTSADTFLAGGFDNLEGLLSEWGVTFRHETAKNGLEECAAVRDTANSLTSDGYTFLASIASDSIASSVDGEVRVSNAGIIDVADGFEKTADGSFTSADKSLNLTTLLRSRPNAEAYAAGRATDRTSDGFSLMTLTKSQSGGSLLACSSSEFASEAAMQNGVYANKDVLLSAISMMGKDSIPVGIPSHPIADLSIRTMTTRTAAILTLVLTAAPAVILSALGAVILIRRKYA